MMNLAWMEFHEREKLRTSLQSPNKVLCPHLSSLPAMEESLEIYQLRLEHKRFSEDAEQERTAKEKLREELVAEIHRRADAEKMIRVLKDEKMKLAVELERLQRLEREWEVKALVSSHFSTNSIVL